MTHLNVKKSLNFACFPDFAGSVLGDPLNKYASCMVIVAKNDLHRQILRRKPRDLHRLPTELLLNCSEAHERFVFSPTGLTLQLIDKNRNKSRGHRC